MLEEFKSKAYSIQNNFIRITTFSSFSQHNLEKQQILRLHLLKGTPLDE